MYAFNVKKEKMSLNYRNIPSYLELRELHICTGTPSLLISHLIIPENDFQSNARA